MTDNIWAAIIGSGGVVLGSLITLLGLWWQSSLQAKREEKIYLKRKRAEVYSEMLAFIRKCIIYKNKEDEENISCLWNENKALATSVMLYSSKNVSDLFDEIENQVRGGLTNNQLQFLAKEIRKELGIKD